MTTGDGDALARRIGALPLFSGLSADDLKAEGRKVSLRDYEEGQWIVAHGDEDRDVFAILSGRVRVMLFGETRELILGDLDPGALFGDMSAIDNGPRSASVIALDSVEVARLSAASFLELVDRHASVRDHVLRTLVARIRHLDHRVHEFASLTVAERVRTELLRLARPLPGRPREAIVTPDLTHAEIAARIGTHREAVTRELGALQRQGAISKENGRLILRNVIALSAALTRT